MLWDRKLGTKPYVGQSAAASVRGCPSTKWSETVHGCRYQETQRVNSASLPPGASGRQTAGCCQCARLWPYKSVRWTRILLHSLEKSSANPTPKCILKSTWGRQTHMAHPFFAAGAGFPYKVSVSSSECSDLERGRRLAIDFAVYSLRKRYARPWPPRYTVPCEESQYIYAARTDMRRGLGGNVPCARSLGTAWLLVCFPPTAN